MPNLLNTPIAPPVVPETTSESTQTGLPSASAVDSRSSGMLVAALKNYWWSETSPTKRFLFYRAIQQRLSETGRVSACNKLELRYLQLLGEGLGLVPAGSNSSTPTTTTKVPSVASKPVILINKNERKRNTTTKAVLPKSSPSTTFFIQEEMAAFNVFQGQW